MTLLGVRWQATYSQGGYWYRRYVRAWTHRGAVRKAQRRRIHGWEAEVIRFR